MTTLIVIASIVVYLIVAGIAYRMSEDEEQAACAWSDYRKEYGVSANEQTRMLEHKAFMAGWRAAREGEQSGVMR